MPQAQRGAVLLLALVFMLMVAIIAATSMRTSILQLHMAGNDQFVEEAFHREHLHRNGTEDPASRVEVLSWGIRVEIADDVHRVPSLAASSANGTTSTDDVVFAASTVRTQRYSGGALRPNQVIPGPAIVDEPTTTVVIPPGWVAKLDGQLNFHLHRDQEAA